MVHFLIIFLVHFLITIYKEIEGNFEMREK